MLVKALLYPELLMRLFTLGRLRKVFCVRLLSAAGMIASGLVVSAHATTGDGSAFGEDDPLSWVNGAFPCFTPRPTPCPAHCSEKVVLAQNFDTVVPPILPPDWLATNALGPPPLWVTSNFGLPMPPADTPPNAAFVDDPGVLSDKRLDSLHFPVSGTGVQLLFEHNFNLEASDVDPNVGFDGGVLEVSFDGGNTFQDILAVGGSFSLGGYNRTISTDRGSPIAGRQAWSGNSEGFICTIVTLPFLPPGGRFRWRMASDNSGSSEGWRVDTILITLCARFPECPPPTPKPRPTPAPRPSP
jgi:hypothetical protein